MADTWQYREGTYVIGTDLRGFGVEATDGHLGSVDAHSIRPDFLVVNTHPRSGGRKRLLPAGAIECIDYENETLHVSLTLDQICRAPAVDADVLPACTALGATYDPYFESFCR